MERFGNFVNVPLILATGSLSLHGQFITPYAMLTPVDGSILHVEERDVVELFSKHLQPQKAEVFRAARKLLGECPSGEGMLIRDFKDTLTLRCGGS